MKRLLSFLRPRRRKPTPRERLAGVLGGIGGAFIGGGLTGLLLTNDPSWTLRLYLAVEITVGFSLLTSAIVIETEEKYKRQALATCLILLLAIPYFSPLVYASTANNSVILKVSQAFDKKVIESDLLNIEELSSTHVRLTYNINGSESHYV